MSETDSAAALNVEVLIVGAGFSGLYQLHKMHVHGIAAHLIEKASGVGGTWYWNRYPGARCDVPSLAYSVSYMPELDQKWTWDEAFSTQDEILKYLQHIAQQLDLYRDISFNTELTGAEWNEEQGRWRVNTANGAVIRAKFLIMATGTLTVAKKPEVAGLDQYRGRWFHTGRWPIEPVNFTGERVSVVGTGSTGIQVISSLADQVSVLNVYQRTPKFTVPLANRLLEGHEIDEMKRRYVGFREECRHADFGYPVDYPKVLLTNLSEQEREIMLEYMWNAGRFPAWVVGYQEHLALKNQAVNDLLSEFARRKIRQIVNDPATAEALTPYGYPIGVNRLCRDTGYYETFNKTHVHLIDTRRFPILEIMPDGIRTAAGVIQCDSIIFATGYDALTGALTSVDIIGRTLSTLRCDWEDGARTYLGVASHGYPNLFMVTGPGSPSVLSNVVVTSEQNVEFITDLIVYMKNRDLDVVEVLADEEVNWMKHVAQVAQNSLYREAHKANAWYTGKNVPGKKVAFLPYSGGVGTYRKICEDVAKDNYRGFDFSARVP